jgi:D-alanyl-D-alanine carboxypeptidase
VPPLDGQALAQSIAGLPGSQETAALIAVGGRSGRWSGASGLASLAASTPALPGDEVRAGSISKTFIATVVLQLAAGHRISLGQPVQHWLHGLLRDGDPPVTIAELLNHTSGLGPVGCPPVTSWVSPWTAAWLKLPVLACHMLDVALMPAEPSTARPTEVPT